MSGKWEFLPTEEFGKDFGRRPAGLAGIDQWLSGSVPRQRMYSD